MANDFHIMYSPLFFPNMVKPKKGIMDASINENKTYPLRVVNILMRKGMGHTAVSAT